MMTEESFIDFKCPHCGEVASFPKDYAGLVQECPNCTANFIVPNDGREVGQKIPLPISTPRLALRRLSTRDWKDLMEFLSDEELFRYQEGRPLGEEEIIRWLEADSQVKLTTPDQVFCLGIESRTSNQLIGYLSLGHADTHRLQKVLTILMGRSHQRKGFATEAVAATFDFCFAGIGLHRVTAFCDIRNLAASRLWEKAGMRREGEFLKDRFVNGEWVDTAWYALLNEEYRIGRNRSS